MSIDLWDETGQHERNLIVHPTVHTAGLVTPQSDDSQAGTDMMVDEPEPGGCPYLPLLLIPDR
jgi:hypothetical protein